MKRFLILLAVLGFSTLCFWYAFSGPSQPSKTAGHGAGIAASLAGPTVSAVAGSTGGTTGGGTGTPNSGDLGGANIALTSGGANTSGGSQNAAANPLICQNSCRSTNMTCQSSCYQSFSVTNQTQAWNKCMQGCGTRMGSCWNACLSGTPLPPAPNQLPVQASAPPAPVASAPTPSLPTQSSDYSSSSQQ